MPPRGFPLALPLLLPACLPRVGGPADSGAPQPDGGSSCDGGCLNGSTCASPFDCASGVCVGSTCQAAAAACADPFAGCTVFDDFTAAGATRIVTFPNSSFTYAPKCMRVKLGQSVTFNGGAATFI